MFEDDESVERENAHWRICQDGLGVELIRRGELPEINARWEAHLSHIKMVDIVALKKAFWLTEQDPKDGGTATLVEAFFKMFQAGLIEASKNCHCHCHCHSGDGGGGCGAAAAGDCHCVANSAEQKAEASSACARGATA